MTGAAEDISIGMRSGTITLDSTITNGNTVIGGTGAHINNTTGSAVVNTDGLINRELITKATWDKIYLDVANGTDSTAFPLWNTPISCKNTRKCFSSGCSLQY